VAVAAASDFSSRRAPVSPGQTIIHIIAKAWLFYLSFHHLGTQLAVRARVAEQSIAKQTVGLRGVTVCACHSVEALRVSNPSLWQNARNVRMAWRAMRLDAASYNQVFPLGL